MARGRTLPNTVLCGHLIQFPLVGRLTAMVTGRGSNLGDGLGWMMLPGDLRLPTMDAGSIGTAAGAGPPDPSGTGTPTMLRPWWAGSEEATSASALDSVAAGFEDRKSTRLNSSHLGISYA